jgi:uncharacterized protein (DUF302 family)
VRRRTVLGAALAACSLAACGTGESVYDLGPPARPGQPAGTVVLTSNSDVAGAVKRLQDAITDGGGTVAATVDHAAEAKAVGVTLAANTVVIGGSTGAQAPLLRVNQRAGTNVPERYLVIEDTGGVATIMYNSADYVAAVSGVPDAAASTVLATEIVAASTTGAGVRSTPLPAPLLGVTPDEFLLVVAGDTTVPSTVARLRANADRATQVVAVIDLAAATPAPTIRPTTQVLLSTPAAEAPLIAAAPSFGLEMPMRYLVWVDDKQITQVGYTDVRLLAARHGLSVTDPNVVRLATDADKLVKIVTGTAA